jgi:hypothetical protein
MAFVALAIRLTGGALLSRTKRASGLGGRCFLVLKFRATVVDD